MERLLIRNKKNVKIRVFSCIFFTHFQVFHALPLNMAFYVLSVLELNFTKLSGVTGALRIIQHNCFFICTFCTWTYLMPLKNTTTDIWNIEIPSKKNKSSCVAISELTDVPKASCTWVSFFFPQVDWKNLTRFSHLHMWGWWGNPPHCIILFWHRGDSLAIRIHRSVLQTITCDADQAKKYWQGVWTEVNQYLSLLNQPCFKQCMVSSFDKWYLLSK